MSKHTRTHRYDDTPCRQPRPALRRTRTRQAAVARHLSEV